MRRTRVEQRIDARVVEASLRKAQRLAERARRKGLSGGWDVHVEERAESTLMGGRVVEYAYPVLVWEGTPLGYDGWSFAATVEWVATSAGREPLIRTMPGYDGADFDRDALREDWCEHCKTRRARKAILIVEKGAERIQVGSTCVKDFLGWDFSPAALAGPEPDGEPSDDWGILTVSTLAAVAFAVRVARRNGWAPASARGRKTPTADHVARWAGVDGGAERRDALAEFGSPDADDFAAAERLIEQGQSLGRSEYAQNLAVALRRERTDRRGLGLAVSVVSMWRAAPPAVVAASEPSGLAEPPAEPVGDVGGGVTYRDTGVELFLDGATYPVKALIAQSGFRFREVPGAFTRAGKPLRQWSVRGTLDQRVAALRALRGLLSPQPAPEAEAVPLADPAPEPEAAAPVASTLLWTPSPQQVEIIDAVRAGDDVVVQALAGTGKTSTLIAVAQAMPRQRIAYIAFNKSVQAKAAAEFPRNAECRTDNSLAYRAVPRWMTARRDDQSSLYRASDVARYLGVQIVRGPWDDVRVEDVARATLDTVRRYCISDSDAIEEWHVPRDWRESAAEIMEWAGEAWGDITSPSGLLATTFYHYVKAWALTRPDLTRPGVLQSGPCDVILFDEAQDINPVLARVIAEQSCQVAYVGDSNQAIYGFAGRTDQLEKVKVDRVLPLTKSWRFGPQIAGAGNLFLGLLGSEYRIEGAGAPGEVVDAGSLRDPDAILVRTNSGAVQHILEHQGQGHVVGAPPGTKQALVSLADTAAWLMGSARRPAVPHEDLREFSSWTEVQSASQSEERQTLATLVRLVERDGPESLRDLASRLRDTGDRSDRRRIDVVVSTAHKAKGLEWPRVRIGGDFRTPKTDPKTGEEVLPSAADLRLAYVAVTRAREVLDPGSLEWAYESTARA